MSKITHDARLKRYKLNAKKGLTAFVQYLVLIADKNPVYCFLCGGYIHPYDRKFNAFQPFGKNGDWVHKKCNDVGISFYEANSKVSDHKYLICHYQVFETYHPEGVCRKKISNTRDELLNHIELEHGDLAYAGRSKEMVQHLLFIRPTGKKFTKPRGN